MARRVLAALAALCALALAGSAAAAQGCPAPIPERAVALIIAFEVGSPALYQRRYRAPIWPGAASGVTVGLGYDLGHRARHVIALDWAPHPQASRLQDASGITGPPARTLLPQLADITVDFPLARRVFDCTSLIEHHRIARRVFVPRHFDQLPPLAQGALVSLVFNRGGSMVGSPRIEMRTIRDECLPRQDLACIARELRAMVRLWQGRDIEQGMRRRRYAEADMAEQGAT